ncbi:MAG: GbsR/MarR family transcriptional regulator, partial [Verrucomicrobiia bacterium]
MAIAEQEIPEKTKPKPLPRVRLELVDIFGRMAQSLSFPRSVGEIYGLLYLASAPMSAPEICEALSISKGSVSTGTRQLLTLGFVRKVWLQEERKDYFEAVLELGEMVRTAYDQIFKMRAQNADRRLTDVTGTLADEKDNLSPEEYALIKERLARLTKLQKRAK